MDDGDSTIIDRRRADKIRALRGEAVDHDLIDEATTGLASESPPARHEPMEQIGQGGMGLIHMAFDPLLRRKVALKSLRGHHATHETSVRRFVREALITAQLDHPHIIPVYGMESSGDGQPAYSMKLIEGQTLKDILEESAAAREAGGQVPAHLTLDALLELFLKACDAVAFAHEKNVLHRDLKPSNIMIGPHGELYVMDWGLAKAQGDEVDVEPTQTAAGEVLGTPRYMAPEQAEGMPGSMGPAADQYALGMILFWMVTGSEARPSKGSVWLNMKAAFDGEVAEMHPPHPNEVVWPALYDVVRRSLEVTPEDRFASVEQLAHAVRWARARPPVPEETRPVQGWISRHLDATLYLGVALLVVLALVFAGSITAAVLGVEIYASRAEVRESRTAALLSLAGERADRVDRAFQLIEAELEAIASTASALHEHGTPTTGELYDPSDYVEDGPHKPPDARHSDLYARVLSTQHPDVSLAPGITRAMVEPEIRRIYPVAQRMRETHLSARVRLDGVDPERAEVLWRTQPGPLRWVMVAADSGFAINVPGGFFVTEGFDHRIRPWYTLGQGASSPAWGLPWQELSTGSLMIACSMEIASRGEPVGVASLAVGFDYVTAEALVLEHPGVIETFLLDDQGRMMMRSSEAQVRGRIGELKDTWATPPYPRLDAVEGRLGVEGVERVQGGEILVVHQPLSLGWSYVVELDADEAGF